MSTKVLIDSAHETMLKELAKKFRATQQDLVEEHIRVNYNIAFKKKRSEVLFHRTIEFKRPEGVGLDPVIRRSEQVVCLCHQQRSLHIPRSSSLNQVPRCLRSGTSAR